MQGLVAIGLGQGDEVLETTRLGLKKAVNCAQGEITVGLGLSDDAKSVEIGHLRK